MYKIIDIIEADFGCEGLPDGEEYCVDIVMQNIETNNIIIVKYPDAELYRKEIDVGSIVIYENNNIILVGNK